MKGTKKKDVFLKTHYFSNSLLSRKKKKSLKKELHATSMVQATKCKVAEWNSRKNTKLELENLGSNPNYCEIGQDIYIYFF